MSESQQVYNTPPNGDFARYVDQLAQQSAANLLKASQTLPPHEATSASGQVIRHGMQAGRKADAAAPVVTPSAPRAASTPSIAPFFGHVKWLIALWIGTQLLGHFFVWAAYLFIPALALYVAWAVMRFRQRSQPGMDARGAVYQVFSRIRQAAADARQEQRRNKPPGA